MNSAAQVPPSTMAKPGRLMYMLASVADSATTITRVSRPTAAPMRVDGFMDLARREWHAEPECRIVGNSSQRAPKSIRRKAGRKGR
ncbi:hypothetical protein D3C87_1696340 [compost metagenome]